MTSPIQFKRKHKRRPPFWQAGKPYLYDQTITDAGFRKLGYMMAFSAGAINAGGFFAVANYTSHVTGDLSRAADSIIIGDWQALVISLFAVISFITGAITASFTILWGKEHHFRSCYGLALWVEAFFLLLFGWIGINTDLGKLWLPLTVLLLCFIMGMHNTVTTMLSASAVRSTHMTGSATDLGIEVTRALYHRKRNKNTSNSITKHPKIRLLAGVMSYFFIGGIIGALGFQLVGYPFILPVVALLLILGINSVGYDIKLRFKWWLLKRTKK